MTETSPDTPYGKRWGLRRLADPDGRFLMLATDQRPPIMGMIHERTGREATDAEVSAVKRLLVEALADDASAVLIDPLWGYPAAFDALRPDRGLILTLEDHRYDESPGGRRSRAIEGWSADRIRRVGADAVKVLAWYRPDADAAVIAHQREFVAACGAACRGADIPFVFELLVHPLGGAGGAAQYETDPAKRPDLVLDSVRAFADPLFGVDLWKLEAPLPPALIPDPDGPEAALVQAQFDRMGALAGDRPWVVLSGGADAQRFQWVCTYAFRAGASGFLAGRSIWADAFAAYPDLARVRAALDRDGQARLRELADLAARLARPWRDPSYRRGGTS